jgi:hypothetical protein
MGIDSSEQIKSETAITTAAPAVSLYQLGNNLWTKLKKEYQDKGVGTDRLERVWGGGIKVKQVENSVVFEPTGPGSMYSLFYDKTGAHGWGLSGPSVDIPPEKLEKEVERRMRETLDICLGLVKEGGTSGGASVPGNVPRRYHHGFSTLY